MSSPVAKSVAEQSRNIKTVKKRVVIMNDLSGKKTSIAKIVNLFYC